MARAASDDKERVPPGVVRPSRVGRYHSTRCRRGVFQLHAGCQTLMETTTRRVTTVPVVADPSFIVALGDDRLGKIMCDNQRNGSDGYKWGGG